MRIGRPPRVAVNRQDLQAAETVIERRQHLGNAIGAPDQRQHAPGFEDAPRRVNPVRTASSRSPHARSPRAVSGEARCRAGSLNGGFISTTSTLSGPARPRQRLSASASTSSTIDVGRDRIRSRIGARKLRQRRIDLDQHQIDAGDAPGNRKARGADAGAEIGHAIARTRRRRRRQQHGIVTGAMSRFQLPQAQLPAEKRILGEFDGRDQSSARNSWARPGIGQKLARLAVVVLMDQDAARQHAERSLDDAHVLVQHQMMDIGAVEQRADRGNQHDIVGPNQFPQFVTLSFARPGVRRRHRRPVNRYLPLPPQPALSIVDQG